jgi:hypothetical protein
MGPASVYREHETEMKYNPNIVGFGQHKATLKAGLSVLVLMQMQ